MIYVLENEFLSVKINSVGAELKSIYSKEGNFEYLWQGNPEYWSGSATVLFPICGRLFGQKYTYQGKEYTMPAHGFARNCDFVMEEKSNTHIVFRIDSNEETLKMYPFNFTFKMIYTLNGKSLKNTFLVENASEEILPFSVGGHPGFSIPLKDGLTLNDHYIEFDESKNRTRLDLSLTCFDTGRSVDFDLIDGKKFNLDSELFKNDGIFINESSGVVSLKSDKAKNFLSIAFNNTTHVGFWQKYTNNTPFICIEPWAGIPSTDGVIDDFSNKNEFIYLKKGKNYEFSFDIIIND